jgi:hypothetical protein
MFGGNGSIRYSIVSVTNICLIALAPIFVAAPRDSTACVTALTFQGEFSPSPSP